MQSTGERLEAARAEDQRWREEQRLRQQSKLDRVCRWELTAGWVCRVVAYLLANVLVLAIISVLCDWAAGIPISLVACGTLLLTLLIAQAAAGTPWAAVRWYRKRIQRQAQVQGVEVSVPEALWVAPRKPQRAPLPKRHAVDHLLELRRTRNGGHGATQRRARR